MLQKVAYGVIEPVKDLYTKFLRYFQNTDLTLSTQQTSQTPTDALLARRNRDNAEQAFSENEINNGSLLNWTVPADVQALYGESMYFDGVNAYVSLGNIYSFERTDSFFIEASFITEANDQAIVSKHLGPNTFRGYNINLTGGKIGVGITCLVANRIDVKTDELFNDGKKHTVRVDYDGSGSASGVTITVDGIVRNYTVFEDTLGTNTIISNAPLTVGARGGDLGTKFVGSIYGVSINGESSYLGNNNTNAGWLDQRVPVETQKMWFDGVDDSVSGISLSLSDGDSLEFQALANAVAASPYLLNGVSTLRVSSAYAVRIRVDSINYTFGSSFPEGAVNTVRLQKTGGNIEVFLDGASLGSQAIPDLSFDTVGVAGTTFLQGTVFSVYQNDILKYLGDSNSNDGWTDQIGANDGTVSGSPARYNPDTGAISNDGTVSGSPALFTGQGFESAAPIVYDQRVPTSTQKMWFDGVDDNVEVAAPTGISGAIKVTCQNIPLDSAGTYAFVGCGDSSGSNNRIIFFQFNDGSSDQGKLGYAVVNAIGGVFQELSDSAVPVNQGDILEVDVINGGSVTFRKNGLIIPSTITANTATATFFGGISGSKITTIGARQVGGSLGLFLKGSISNVQFLDDSGVITNQYLGDSNTDAGWVDQIGANNGTVNGSPARYNPKTGAISRDAVQTTAANQPLIVKDGQLVLQNTKELLDFDGTADYMRIPDAQMPTLTDKLQVSAVCRNNKAALGIDRFIFGQYDYSNNNRSWIMGFDADERILIAFGDPVDGTFEGLRISSSAITINELQVIGFRFDAGTIKIYKNGVEITSQNSNGTPPSALFNSAIDWTIGVYLNNNSPANFWDGQIGEIYFSDTLEDDIVKVQQNQMKRYNI